MRTACCVIHLLLGLIAATSPAAVQMPPSDREIALYRGLHAAAAKGDVMGIAVGVMLRTR